MAAFYDAPPRVKTPRDSLEVMGHKGMQLLT
jgi:hypothetical protein